MPYSCLELCAGAGGQALGFERAGFDHVALVELDPDACATLRLNRQDWNVIGADVRAAALDSYSGVDVIAAGVPCPPFSIAGKQLGADDDRDLFPTVARLARILNPRAIVFENVRGFVSKRFQSYRRGLDRKLKGYVVQWKLLNAADFDVPQSRLRAVGVALRPEDLFFFHWPEGHRTQKTVGSELGPLMMERGWLRAPEWARQANRIAPTIVGGSHRHGGPDLGPTRARAIWRTLGVDGTGLADAAPNADFVGLPKLTVSMASVIQGFPPDWKICGRKTAAYRQVGNALPPPVAHAVASALKNAFAAADDFSVSRAS